MHERVREPHGEKVERHEGAGDDCEYRRVTSLALRVLDREAHRLMTGVEQEND